jgi:hypothetical protein
MQTQDVTASQSADAQIKQNLQRSFESVKRSYEAVGTAPRSDMGDSITKAFANIDELLGELDIDVNYESRRAARILGYNNMEITQENIDSIVGYDREVNRLMDNFYPEAVMGIIKDGINPMDVSIDQLNDIISQKNYNGGVSDAKNFATYLRDVEKRGEITDEERESYIGIYRVMDKLAKSGDREAGYVFANQANLTIRNMISAMRSRKAKGIDVDVDDSFGMLEDVKGYGVRMDEQIEAGFESGSNSNAGSNTSSNTNPDANANTSSNENSNASSNANSNTNELARQLERYRQLNPNVESFIQENEIQYNMNNAFAVDALLNEDEGVYKLIYEAMQKLDFKDESEENLIDEETGNMAASLMGEDVDIDPFAALESENLMRQLSEGGDLSLTYEDIEKQLTELMYDAGAAGLISSLDISAIKAASAGVSLLGQMSKQDSYQIPVDTAQGTTVVNLTLKNAERGSAASMSDGISPTVIEANMKSDTVGNLTAKIEVTSTVDGDLDVIGEFVSDSSEGNEILQGMTDVVEKLKSSLQGVFAANTKSVSINISFGTKALNENSYAKASGSAGVSRGTACRAAVDVVRTMTDVMEIFTGNF